MTNKYNDSKNLCDWVSASNGQVPEGAVIGGKEPGRDLPICRARYRGGVHPGKIVGRNCNIGYGGHEIEIPDYEVLVSQSQSSLTWVSASNGQVPEGAVIGGKEPGRDLPICRARYRGGVHPGKIVGRNCNIGYGSDEIEIPEYEVLVNEAAVNEGFSIKFDRKKVAKRTYTNISKPSIEKRQDYICKTEKRKISANYDEVLALDPTVAVIYPGSVIDFASIQTGGYTPVSAPRAPLTLSISTEHVDGAVHETVDSPDLASVRTAVNRLVKIAVSGATAANVLKNEETVYSRNQLKVALGGQFSKGPFDISGSFDFSRTSVTNKLIVKYLQIYYSISINIPPRPEDFFTITRPISPDEAYVATMTYGRMLLFTFESTEDISRLKIAAELAARDDNVKLSVEQEKVLENTRCGVLIRGGSSVDANAITGTNRSAAIRKYITDGAVFDKTSPAYPLSYTLRYVSDNAIANMTLSDTYIERQCCKATGTFVVTVKRMELLSGGSFAAELFGNIAVIFYQKEKAVKEEYVWSKGKKQKIKLKKGEKVGIDKSVTYKYENWINPFYDPSSDSDQKPDRETGFVEIKGHLLEKDPFRVEDFGTESKKIRLKTAVGGEDKLYFAKDEMRVEVVFEVKPVV